MKKIIIIVAAVAVLAVGGAAVVFLQKGKQDIAIESLLPTKPVFYFHASQISQRLDNFSKTKLFQDLKSIDYKGAATTMGATPDSLSQAENAWTSAFTDENQKIFKGLFGNEVALAVYTDGSLKNIKAGDPKAIADMLSNVFIVTKLSPEIAAAEVVSKFWGQFNKDLKMVTEKYNGKEINLISNTDGSFTLGYVRFNDYVVMGVGNKAAKAAIDVAAKKQKALGGDAAHLKRSKRAYEDGHTFGYFDITTFYPFLTDEITQLASSDQQSAVYKAQLEEQLKQIKGLDAMVFSSKPGDVMTFKADLLYDKAALSPEMSVYYNCGPQENQSAKFVPWDALVYQWNNCMDFSEIWKQYKTQMALQGQAIGQDIDVNKMAAMYEQMLGLTIEGDILPTLGKEFGFYMTDVDVTSIFPIPKFVFFIETTSRDRGDTLINKLLALQPALQFEEQEYNGEKIRFIPIPLAEGLALSYTYVGNTLLLASGIDILRSSLDAVKDPSKSIGITAALRSVPGPKNSVFFVQVDRLLKKVEAVLEWSEQAAKQNQIQQQAFLAGSQKNLEDLRKRNEELAALIAAQGPEALEAGKELAANQEKETNLVEQMKYYETKVSPVKTNDKVVDDMVKPLLKAFSNIKYLNATTVNSDGVLGSTMQMKIE